MCCFLSIYQVNIPSNTDIYISEFRNLIQFDVADPQSIIEYVYPNFSFEQTVMSAVPLTAA